MDIGEKVHIGKSEPGPKLIEKNQKKEKIKQIIK